ncbi:fumarylacetoacetate hydrolase family protein [Lysobacter sp. Root690]|uniref:fumarylacetoacetate hydrolase family protein n=1 Tax=Lysobacter sp. Root690 TaxID=1736588 RepID=UPI0006FC929B|nr:fumarylacetoacetate hydrolase family protein [Lysobacter sp. Root690]KRB10261.1 fumarylacetoacetate hydrolase [Lysobacter sp. Root690]
MSDVIAAPPLTRIPVRGQGLAADATFPVRRVYCVGRNFAEHAREMGAAVPTSAADRGQPVFFLKPHDSLELGDSVPYPPGTSDLHHEVELVVAIGRDAPAGELAVADAANLIYGYAVGLDLTRRDLQSQAKAKGLPWDTGKSFDHAAPISAIVPVAEVGELGARSLSLEVNGEPRQRGTLDDLVWNVPEILHELSRLYALRAGDLVYMGTPSGVGPLQRGDRYRAVLEGVAELHGRIT